MEYLPVSEVATPQDETGLTSIPMVEWLRYKQVTVSSVAWLMVEKVGVVTYLASQKAYKWVKTKAS